MTPNRNNLIEELLSRIQPSKRRRLEIAAEMEENKVFALSHGMNERWLAAEPNAAPPFDGWQSYDRTPWLHPWMTSDNIRHFARFSTRVIEKLRTPRAEPKLAFVSNLANYNYTRMHALKSRGYRSSLHLHPLDNYPMSLPAWEEFDGDVGAGSLDDFAASGLPPVDDVHRADLDLLWSNSSLGERAPFLRPADVLRYMEFMPYLPTLSALQDFDVLCGADAAWLAYLAGKPYASVLTGGEIWFLAARADALGRLQRATLRNASAILVSNPISLAHARRLGLTNLVYLPWFLDETRYSPGEAEFRPEWVKRSGGDFFVFSSARIDDLWKGSSVGIQGFAKFAASDSGARLVVTSWGKNIPEATAYFRDIGIAERVLFLPASGKRRLIAYLRSADCMIEQFRLGYYGGSALEALACGLPVIMRLERAQYDALNHTGAPPVLEAATADEVASQLAALRRDTSRQAEIRARSRLWFLENHSAARWADPFIKMVAGIARGWHVPDRRSPLKTPLTAAEQDYHDRQLRDAPPFPEYLI